MAQVVTGGPGSSGRIDLRGNPARHRREKIIRTLFKSAAVLSVVISAAIVLSLIGRAVEFLFAVDLSALFSPSGWFPRRGFYDLRAIVGGTLIISGIAIVVAAPLGLGAAVYLAEYARPRTRRTLKPILEILAGIPSVVLGFFALTWIGPEIVQGFLGGITPASLMTAGIAVGVLITPLVASVSEDALRAVPNALREASYGLGARRMSTTVRVILPAAVSGIAASIILAVSRAIGETMIVAMAAGASGGGTFTLDPLERGQTMTGAMASLAIGSDQVKGQENTFESLFFVGMLLFLMTMALNIVSERFVRRVREKY